VIAFIPGGERKWTDVLPEPYGDDPAVVITMVPVTAKTQMWTRKDGTKLRVLLSRPDAIPLGLHVMDEKLTAWLEHEEAFARENVGMARVHYIGPLSSVPNHLLLSTTLTPIIFLRDSMGSRYWTIKSWLQELFDDNDD
jgi:hypothetical protein